MIARHEANVDKMDVWAQLSAPLPSETIAWRQDGRPIQREGKFFARFVAYVEANTVRERLDGVVPGEWDLTLELMPTLASDDNDEARCSFKARLQILGVIREDVGTGRDYKQASTDAFKRAAVRFGIAHELYSYEQNWVQVDGDGKYAKPVEDPADAYARRANRSARLEAPARGEESRREDPHREEPRSDEQSSDAAVQPARAREPLTSDEPDCPVCGGRMWDNRLTKRNPRAPDYKCRSRSCDGVIWPARGAASATDKTVPATDDNADTMVELGELKELPF
jgi:hypothetical protein